MKFCQLALIGVLYLSTRHADAFIANFRNLEGGRVLTFSSDGWNGEVVSNTPDGKIQGSYLQQVGEKLTEWTVTINGVEADLGRFSEAIYRKITNDAKRQKFQGFRPGTIPPHLEPTYRAFSMDECARETVLEAMQQNNIRPFESARSEMKLESFIIPKPKAKSSRKKNKRGSQPTVTEEFQGESSEWLSFPSMKEAIDAGWRPGQSFSFVATNVKGQQLKDSSETKGARPLGLDY